MLKDLTIKLDRKSKKNYQILLNQMEYNPFLKDFSFISDYPFEK